MRFMIIRKADADTEAGTVSSERLLADTHKFHEELAEAGILLAADGLQPTSKAAQIKFSDGRPTITDGPFAVTKEVIAGYTMIQACSRAEALESVKRWPPWDGNGPVELELRQMLEAADLGPELTLDLQVRAEQLRASIGQK